MREKPLFKSKLSRKNFLKACMFGGLSFLLFKKPPSDLFAASFNGRAKRPVNSDYDLVSVTGPDPYGITMKAVESLGGMGKFVKQGSTVLIKPNIGWDRSPEQAATTNPSVVGALIDMAFKAGAKRVNIFDVPCNDAKRCYENSGIEKIAKEKGANIYFPEDWNVVKANFDFDSPMQDWPILRDALECDTFINVPILKNHGLTGLTLSMKNLMGVCVGRRGLIHQDIARKLVDLTGFINPELTIIDAFRVLVRNGPTGGSLDDVVQKNTVIASTDPTLADIYACKLMDTPPENVSYVAYAIKKNFGITDIAKAKILKV